MTSLKSRKLVTRELSNALCLFSDLKNLAGFVGIWCKYFFFLSPPWPNISQSESTKAPKLLDRQILFRSEIKIDSFWATEAVKYLVGYCYLSGCRQQLIAAGKLPPLKTGTWDERQKKISLSWRQNCCSKPIALPPDGTFRNFRSTNLRNAWSGTFLRNHLPLFVRVLVPPAAVPMPPSSKASVNTSMLNGAVQSDEKNNNKKKHFLNSGSFYR